MLTSRTCVAFSFLVLTFLSCVGASTNQVRRARLEQSRPGDADRALVREQFVGDLEIEERRARVRAMRTRLDAARREQAGLVSDLDAALRTVEALEQDLRAARDRNAALEAELSRARAHHAATRAALASLASDEAIERDRLEAAVAASDARLANLRLRLERDTAAAQLLERVVGPESEPRAARSRPHLPSSKPSK